MPSRILIVTGDFPGPSFIVAQVEAFLSHGWDVRVSAAAVDDEAHAALRDQRGLQVDADSTAAFVQRYRRARLRALALLVRRFGLGIRSRLLALPRRSMRLRAAALLDTMRAWRPDLAYANWGDHGLVAAVAARRAGLPVAVHFRGYDVTRLIREYGWRPYRRVLRGVTAVCHAEAVERLLRANLPVPVRRIRYGGVDRQVFRAAERAESWPSPLHLAFIGRLVAHKGPDTAIATLALLRREHPELDARLTLVGEGPLEQALQAQAEELEVTAAVSFAGALPHDEVARILGCSDLLLTPSRRSDRGDEEVFCNVAAEGMVCGLPVIGTPCGGVPDTIGGGGWVAASDRPRDIAATIARVVARESPRTCRGRALASAARFSRAAMFEDYDAVAREVAERAPDREQSHAQHARDG